MSMEPQSIGGHAGDLARFSPYPKKGKVIAVRQGQSIAGGVANQWVCDLDCTDGAFIPNAMVIGPRVPLVHTTERPSWGAVGFFGANLHEAFFCPATWTGEGANDIATHELLDLFTHFTFHIFQHFYTIKVPAPAGTHEERLLEIHEPAAPGGISFQMLGGTRRVARAGGVGDGADTRGDYVAIDVTSSPAFIGWIQAVTTALAGVQATLAALATGQAALAAQTEALRVWGLTVAPPLPGPFPPAPVAPPAPPAPPALPLDPVPDVEGSGNLPGAVAQVVGQIVSGSSTVRGR